MAGASNNGGWASDGGSPDDLPDLPEEWGVIVIPDDLSELTDEVEAIRAELHHAEPTGWQRFLQRPAGRRLRKLGAAPLRAPVLIISLAVLVTIASLFASAWPGPPRQPAAQRTVGTTPDERVGTLPALELFGTDGQPVPLRGSLPAVIMMIDGCACTALVTDTIAAVPRQVAVVTVTSGTAPSAGTPPTGAAPQTQGKTVRALHDPAGSTRSQLKLGEPDGTAAVLLVNSTGAIVRTVPRIASVEDIRPDLARL
jgi:hypothetical protein